MSEERTVNFFDLELPNGARAYVALDRSGRGIAIPCTSASYKQDVIDGYVSLFLNGEKVVEVKVPQLANGDTINLPPFVVSSA